MSAFCAVISSRRTLSFVEPSGVELGAADYKMNSEPNMALNGVTAQRSPTHENLLLQARGPATGADFLISGTRLVKHARH